MTDRDPLLDTLCADLRAAHGAHAIVLYGSHADGTATPESDVDIAVFADVERELRDARWVHGVFLDAFVHPLALLDAEPGDALLKLGDSVVLLDDDGRAARLVERVRAKLAAGPAALAEDDAQMRRTWAWKMMDRIGRGDAEGDYRRHWLLMQLLEDWFALRGRWYLGPKRALAWLQREDPAAHALFAAALRPGAEDAAIRALVTAAAGPDPRSGHPTPPVNTPR